MIRETPLRCWPMSAGQRALWFEQCANPGSNAYNLGACIHFKHPIDRNRLDSALASLAQRHAIMRARFDLVDEQPGWFVSPSPLLCLDLADGALPWPQARARIEEMVLHPYALADEHPYRFGLVAVDDGCLFGMACHHIVSDLHSVELLLRDLEQAYASPETFTTSDAAHYAEFCSWQADMLHSGSGTRNAQFWRERLAASESSTSFLPGTQGPAERLDFAIEPAVSTALVAAASRAGATAYGALLTTLQIILAQWSGSSHALVGTPFSGRTKARFRHTMGYFVNLLPMTFEINASESYLEALTRNAALIRSALRHGQYPFAAMVENLGAARTPGNAPLIGATLTFQNTAAGLNDDTARLALGLPGGRLRLGDESGEMVALPDVQAQFPLGITIAPTAAGFEGSMQFDPAAVSAEDAATLLNHWLHFLNQCAQKPEAGVGSLSVKPIPRPSEDTLASAIEDCILRYADRPAISSPKEEINYRQLGERSMALAVRLHELGAGRGARVAVIGSGGADTVAAMVGVMRAGAAFVPIDADAGVAHIEMLLQAARVSAMVVCDDAAPPWSEQLAIPRIAMPQQGQGGKSFAPRAGPLDPAWLMCTSGTTGTPKAAIVPHEAALAHAKAIAERFDMTPADRVLQFASLSFDEHAEEIFPTLLAGACVVCMPRVRFEDPESLLQKVGAAAVSVLHLPTSYWHLWVDEMTQQMMPVPPGLRLVNAGGEQASVARLRHWAALVPHSIRWFNSYGLTEAAVTSLLYELPRDPARLESMARVPAGKPIAGTLVRVDAADGDVGELLLGGTGVGTGYLDNPEQNARFFSEGSTRWLKTGDMAMVNLDGDIEIAGRRDRLIKLRGMRVALPEIEAAMVSHCALKECVAMNSEPGSAEGIDLHVALFEGYAASEVQLRAHLTLTMPTAPSPSHIHFHGAIPRTAGRKPDFAKLAEAQAASIQGIEPRYADAVTKMVAEIFSRHLATQQTDHLANFFTVGGHSLLAMAIVASVRRVLGVSFTISDFLAAPTISGVAALCRSRGALPQAAHIRPAGMDGGYPLSRAQMRALALTSASGQSHAAASMAVLVQGQVDATEIERSVRKVVARHRLLSASITVDGNSENSAVALRFQTVHLEGPQLATLAQRRLVQLAREVVPSPIDQHALSATLVAAGLSKHVLFIDARHVAVDGGCVPLMLREIGEALGSATITTPARSYREYVAAESQWLESPARSAAFSYWRQYLEGASQPTRLPEMAATPSDDFGSRRLRFTLTARTRQQLLALASARQCSPFAVLLSAFLVLIHRYTSDGDILIGVPVSLREVFGARDAVGPMLNALPFRASVAPDDALTDILQRTHRSLSNSLEHAPLPFEEIADLNSVLREAGATPIPIQVVAQDEMQYRAADGRFAISDLQEREGRSPAALLVGLRIGAQVRIEFEYRRALFSDAAAVRLIRSMQVLLRELLNDPTQSISRVRMLSQCVIARAFAQRPLVCPRGFPTLLHGGLTAGARLHPENAAIIHGDGSWTYQQLENLSNSHARRLIAAGLQPGERVIVASQKGVEEIVAVIAILKAGGVYVPVAGDLPIARASALAQRTAARLITGAAGSATDFGHAERFRFIAVELVECGDVPPPAAVISEDASAYILFTSGSTGEPKGVEVSHRAALTTIGETVRRFDITRSDVFYGVSALGFDLSVFDIFGALAAGGTLVVPAAQSVRDPFVWMADVVRHNVTIWNTVPSSLDMLLAACGSAAMPSLRRLLISGDWIGLNLPPRARSACPAATFVALGGATEAAIWSNCHVVDEVDPTWRSIPYGNAMNGQSMFVADPGGWPSPVGVVGEICIGGEALAKGYWADPELTAAKFVTHAQSGGRIYRTGDMGRYFADGSIEFVGRRDRQIKLRGYRIEIGDIECALATMPGVGRALVRLMHDESGTPQSIAAYVQPAEGTAIEAAGLRRHVENELPHYMRPAHYCVLEQIPLTANGKIDWASFPPPVLHASPHDVPFTENEKRLAGLWRELVPGRAPGRDDNFFISGGNSMEAVKLASMVGHEFGRSPSLSTWLSEPTIAHMARLLDGAQVYAAPAPGFGAKLRSKVRLADDIVFSPPKAAGDIFITGATGLIGSRLIARCLTATSRKVVCLVRNSHDASVDGRIAQFLLACGMADEIWQNRVRFVCGDLAQHRFGLTAPAFESLARDIATVFHVGAHVNLIAGYDALEAANVGGTHEAIRLAALAGAALQYVSSVGVLPYGAGTTVFETDSIDAPGALLTGYCESKWVAEQTVRMAAANGLRATVYRPGLTLDETTAAGGDMLGLLMALTSAVGALPRLDMPVDIATADYVTAAMVQIAEDVRSHGGTFHLTHPQPINLIELVEQADIAIPMLPFAAWRTELEQALPGISDPRVAALGAMIASHEEADITPARIDCSGTAGLLRGTGIDCLPVASILQTKLRAN